MTHIYDWFSFPDKFSVKCPNCGKESQCSEVYKCEKPLKPTELEHYWKDRNSGVFECNISCLVCGLTCKRIIHWPQDAFWSFNVKGKVLWAWSLEHANIILEYLSSKDRIKYPKGYKASLLHLPEHFKLAKNRNAVIKSIIKRIQSNT